MIFYPDFKVTNPLWGTYLERMVLQSYIMRIKPTFGDRFFFLGLKALHGIPKSQLLILQIWILKFKSTYNLNNVDYLYTRNKKVMINRWKKSPMLWMFLFLNMSQFFKNFKEIFQRQTLYTTFIYSFLFWIISVIHKLWQIVLREKYNWNKPHCSFLVVAQINNVQDSKISFLSSTYIILSKAEYNALKVNTSFTW